MVASTEVDPTFSALLADEPGTEKTPEGDALAAAALAVIPGLASGDGPAAPRFRDVLKRWGTAPLATLFALNLVDELDRIALVTLAPDIRRAFGLSNAALGALSGIGAIALIFAAIPFGVLGDRGSHRTRIAAAGGIFWGVIVLLTGAVQSGIQLALARVLTGVGQASVDPIHGSLLADYYPPESRGRVYGIHQAANPAAGIIGPILAGAIAAVAGWRWAFAVLAIPSVIAALAALRLREPRRGQHERGDTDTEIGPVGAKEPDDADVPDIPLATAMRRLTSIRTLKYLYVGIGVLGFGLVAGGTLISVYFEEQWGVGELGRGFLFSIMAVGTAGGLLVGGVVGDRLFRHNPSWPLYLVGAGIAAYSAITSIAVWMPALWLVVTVLTLALAGVGAATASLRLVVAAVAPPNLRSLAFAMLGIYIALYGGFLGGIIFGAIADATSPRVSLSLLVGPGLVAGLLIAHGARYVRADIAEIVADLRAEEVRRVRVTRPDSSRSLLEIRNLDFSYGPVQVLFDVDLEVPEGEIVALLGTNGAGKSTLLRAITGLDHPTRGTIHFDGHDVTYLEAEQLLGLGIAQMPGGKAVFGGLSVAENLRVGAFTFRKDRARIDAEVAQVEAWFPILAERRTQLAAKLSGGEQQMLALGKAFLTRPRLLCIDELSLGLAPGVVASLLDIVREMHRRGTTIVIVEQSLNVALSLATTAVFMEKGQVRFTGAAKELLERPDLARSVFLDGAARPSGGQNTRSKT